MKKQTILSRCILLICIQLEQTSQASVASHSPAVYQSKLPVGSNFKDQLFQNHSTQGCSSLSTNHRLAPSTNGRDLLLTLRLRYHMTADSTIHSLLLLGLKFMSNFKQKQTFLWMCHYIWECTKHSSVPNLPRASCSLPVMNNRPDLALGAALALNCKIAHLQVGSKTILSRPAKGLSDQPIRSPVLI